MDSPLAWGVTLLDPTEVDKGSEGKFKGVTGCKRPDGNLLSLDRDLLEGIVGDGLCGHELGYVGRRAGCLQSNPLKKNPLSYSNRRRLK